MTKHLLFILLLALLTLPIEADELLGETSFNATEYNFGSFHHGIIRHVVFVFTNTGNAPVVIQSTETACGCTSVTYSSKPVLPGKKGYITVWYDSNKAGSGKFRKSVDVHTNAKTSIVRLFINGESK